MCMHDVCVSVVVYVICVCVVCVCDMCGLCMCDVCSMCDVCVCVYVLEQEPTWCMGGSQRTQGSVLSFHHGF